MTNNRIQRYTVSGDIAYPIHEDPEGDYVAYEDHVAAIEADRKRRGEPVAWAMFADNGNIRIWARKPMSHPDCVPLYTAPQPDDFSAQLNRIDESMKAGARLTKHRFRLDAPQPAEPVKVPSEAEEALWKAYESLRELEKQIVLDVNPISGAAAANFAANRVLALLARYGQEQK